MSEFQADPSTTPESQKNTQLGISPTHDFNFTLRGCIHLDLDIDPTLVPFLRMIVNRLPGDAEEAHEGVIEDIGEPMVDHVFCLDNEPLEIDPNVPENVEPEKYGHIVYGEEDSWRRVQKYKNLKWKVEGRKLLLRYWSGNVSTTWENMERLARLPEKQRNQEINTLSNSCNYKTAMRIFAKCIDDGLVQIPANPDGELEENFAKFVEEEDSNTAFVEG